MSAQNSEVNRNIDTQTAEGHVAKRTLEPAEDAGKRSVIRHADALDDEAEGHRKMV